MASTLLVPAMLPSTAMGHGSGGFEARPVVPCFAYQPGQPPVACFRLEGSASPAHATFGDLRSHGYFLGGDGIIAAQGSPNHDWVIAKFVDAGDDGNGIGDGGDGNGGDNGDGDGSGDGDDIGGGNNGGDNGGDGNVGGDGDDGSGDDDRGDGDGSDGGGLSLPSLSIADAMAAEGGTARFAVTLSAASDRAVTVSYWTASGTASEGTDYDGASGTLTFSPGTTRQVIAIQTREDDLAEPDEAFTVTLSEPSGATLAVATAAGTIADDYVPALSIADATAVEGERVRFAVTLSAASDRAVTVSYRTAGGTASSGVDFDAVSGTLTFGPRTTQQIVAVQTREDDLDEPDEAFTVTVSDPSGATLADASGTGTITDDDARPGTPVEQELLAELGRALAFTAVRCRIEQVFSDKARGWARPAARASLSLAPPPQSFARSLLEWTDGDRASPDPEEMPGNASFLLPLTGDAGGATRLAAWGCGEYRSLAGDGGSAVGAWEGEAFSLQVGADAMAGPDLLAGVSLSRTRGSLEFDGASGKGPRGGRYELQLTGIHPYLGWWVYPGIEVWGTLGLAGGELRIADDGAGSFRTRASTLASGTVGASGRLFEHGGTSVRLRGEWSLARLDVAGTAAAVRNAAVDLRRLRLAAEIDHEQIVPYVGVLAPWGELGLRHDGGDGGTGAGVEAGGGLHYRNVEQGWNTEVYGRWLVAHDDALPDEWGIGLRLRYDPQAPGFGPWVNVAQTWGAPVSGVPRLWEDELSGPTAHGSPARRLEVKVGYGFAAFEGRGMLTPYGAVSLEGADARRYGTGVRLTLGPSALLSLEADRRERPPAHHAIMLRSVAQF